MTQTTDFQQDISTASPEQIAAAAAVVVDELTHQAAKLVIDSRKASTSYLQRNLSIGYNRAARLMEHLEALGIVTSADHVGQRDVVATELPAELAAAEMARAGTKKRTPMKETAADVEVKNGTYGRAAGELKQIVERFERLEIEKKEVADQQKEVMAEAKGRGYDTKVLRKVIALRKRDKDDIAEEEAVLEMYKAALGMD
ncbi:DUF2312 domain-containing protein [Salipiger pacificus]|uniref:DUF2312 domain-containing protein n=2 Tax=Salipiger mangrovisoli TaxID=2865933 RepID=A0ABR9WWT6_9RHOB|nr:DUF2312 domain-containing protein [Salipiger mangrovisoli]